MGTETERQKGYERTAPYRTIPHHPYAIERGNAVYCKYFAALSSVAQTAVPVSCANGEGEQKRGAVEVYETERRDLLQDHIRAVCRQILLPPPS